MGVKGTGASQLRGSGLYHPCWSCLSLGRTTNSQCATGQYLVWLACAASECHLLKKKKKDTPPPPAASKHLICNCSSSLHWTSCSHYEAGGQFHYNIFYMWLVRKTGNMRTVWCACRKLSCSSMQPCKNSGSAVPGIGAKLQQQHEWGNMLESGLFRFY